MSDIGLMSMYITGSNVAVLTGLIKHEGFKTGCLRDRDRDTIYYMIIKHQFIHYSFSYSVGCPTNV